MIFKDKFIEWGIPLISAWFVIALGIFTTGCGGGGDEGDTGGNATTPTVNLGITAAANADLNSSYENAKTDIYVSNFSVVPQTGSNGTLRDAIAYLDMNGDGYTDIFMATGEYLLQGEVNSAVALNNGTGVAFTASTAEFAGNMPPATHARKSIVSDFNNDNLKDILVFDHGYDADPFPGSQLKLIIQNTAGSFTWSKLTHQTGFHHGGAAADIDNDGDIDVFVGGFSPYFLVNDGAAQFTKVDDRFDHSMNKVFSTELIDVDKDGFVDLLIGAHERDGDVTRVYWGSTTGSYNVGLSYTIPPVALYGAILDFDAEDFDGDGNRDIIVNRTRDGDDGAGLGFYVGRTIQLLKGAGSRSFTDVTATNIDFPGGASDGWFPWVRTGDINNDGYTDIGPDDVSKGFGYMNNGSGFFVKTAIP